MRYRRIVLGPQLFFKILIVASEQTPVARHSRISSGEKMAYAVSINLNRRICTGNLRSIEQVRRTDSILFHVDSGLKHFWKHDCTRSLDEEEEWVWGRIGSNTDLYMLTGNHEKEICYDIDGQVFPTNLQRG